MQCGMTDLYTVIAPLHMYLDNFSLYIHIRVFRAREVWHDRLVYRNHNSEAMHATIDSLPRFHTGTCITACCSVVQCVAVCCT